MDVKITVIDLIDIEEELLFRKNLVLKPLSFDLKKKVISVTSCSKKSNKSKNLNNKR